MKNLVSISVFLLLSTGCALNLFDVYSPESHASVNRNAVSFWFQSDTTFSLYNITMDFPGQHLTGLLAVNPDSSGGYRIVYLTEFGLKMVDIEFLPFNQTIVHYCMPALNRKRFIKSFQNDIGLLLQHMPGEDNYTIMHDKQSDNLYRNAEADVNVGSGEYLLCRRQTGGVAKLANCIGFEIHPFGGENHGVCNHLALPFHEEAKRVFSNKFWRLITHDYTP